MALALTWDVLAAAYEFFRVTPPFIRWRLPAAEQVEFRVINNKQVHGWYRRERNHVIAISCATISHTSTLMVVMAHEMLHLYQHVNRRTTRTEHNNEFKQLSEKICRHHGFDPRAF